MNVARDELRKLIGNAPCDHPSSSLAACQWCVTDAILANPAVVLRALGGALIDTPTGRWFIPIYTTPDTPR